MLPLLNRSFFLELRFWVHLSPIVDSASFFWQTSLFSLFLRPIGGSIGDFPSRHPEVQLNILKYFCLWSLLFFVRLGTFALDALNSILHSLLVSFSVCSNSLTQQEIVQDTANFSFPPSFCWFLLQFLEFSTKFHFASYPHSSWLLILSSDWPLISLPGWCSSFWILI